MFRVMKKGDVRVEVYGWSVTKNGWEYYFLDSNHIGDIRKAVVYGYETEMGDVSQREIQPYLLRYAHGKALEDIAPAPDWQWE